MGVPEHTYNADSEWCSACGGPGGCKGTPPPAYVPFKAPREDCQHPREALCQMWQDACDPDLVTVCARCGVAFPGKTIEDLLAA